MNTVKTTVTAILYRSAAASLAGRPLKDKLEQLPRAQLENKIMVQGQPIKYVSPSDPSKYLGVMVTPTLDWKPQYQYILQKVKDKGQRLRHSTIPVGMKMKILQTVVKPMITYSFSVMPYTPAQIKTLDAQLASVVKNALGQRKSCPM